MSSSGRRTASTFEDPALRTKLSAAPMPMASKSRIATILEIVSSRPGKLKRVGQALGRARVLDLERAEVLARRLCVEMADGDAADDRVPIRRRGGTLGLV